MADNFQKLINLIEGDANVLVQKCRDKTAAEPLRRIAATAGCASGLTRQLLALVRRHPMRPQPLDLNKLIEDHTGTVNRLLEITYLADLIPIYGDEREAVQSFA